MGIYFNPTNESFTKDRNYEIYVDKTELIAYLNKVLGTPRNCLSVSHARRFGKSHAAGMIDAYYSLGCDSSKLFDNTKISSFWDDFKDNLVEKIKEYIIDDFKKSFNDEIDYSKKFSVILMSVYKKNNYSICNHY